MRLRSHFFRLFRRTRMEREMDAELRFHIQSRADELARGGTPRREAERQARIEFGSLESFKEECREESGLRPLDELRQDARHGLRILRKSPAYAVVTILTLALGIGANTSIFSLVHAWVLRPLPFPDPDRLVIVWDADTKRGSVGQVAPADFCDWREQSGVFESAAAWTGSAFNLTGVDRPERLSGARVTADFFRVLGVAPALGRDFTPRDDEPGASRVAIVSDGLWRQRFGADPGLVGRAVLLDGEPTTVVGVMPSSFHFTLMGRAAVWAPLQINAAQRNRRDPRRWLSVVGRLRTGIAVEQGRAALGVLAEGLERAHPETNRNHGVRVRTLHEEIGRHTGNEQVLIVYGIVGCILLISCANVANLMIARAAGRRREIALRMAVGAGRFRVIRQFLTENLILFVAAAAAGAGFAVWGVQWIVSSIPYSNRGYLPNYGALSVDLPVLGYTLAVAVAVGLVFGLAPAVRGARVDCNHALKESGRSSQGAGDRRLQNVLVSAEIALALVVLVSTGLLIRSLNRMYAVNPGFDPTGLLTAQVTLPASKYPDLQKAAAFYRDAAEQLRALPGVRAAGASQYIPYGPCCGRVEYTVDGQPRPATNELPTAQAASVTPDYLEALAVPLLAGRYAAHSDTRDAAAVVVINETMAKRHWPKQEPLGRRIYLGRDSTQPVTIVGVVKDVKPTTLMDPPVAQLYLPYQQSPVRGMIFAIRTDSDPASIGPAIRGVVWAIDRSQPVSDVETMTRRMDDEHAPYLILGQAMGFFAALGLFLAAIGIYGVVSHSAEARTQEIGIRLALGADPRRVLRLVLRQGMVLAAAGVAVGIAGAFGVTRLMTILLFDVSPTDPTTFVLTSLLLGAVALAACAIPARRAARVDPIAALRYE